MGLLNKLEENSAQNAALQSNDIVRVYSTREPLEADEVFNSPAAMRAHLYDDIPDGDDWIAWGPASHIRVHAFADQASAVDGVLIEYTNDGENAEATALYEESAVANTELESGWIERKGVGFRFSYTNGPVAQSLLFLDCEITRQLFVNTA